MKPFAPLAAAALLVAAAPFDPFGQARIDDRPGAQIPLDGPFADAAGHRTTLRQLAAGKPMLLAPVQHNCPNICGVTLAGLADVTAKLPAGDIAIVALGIDPRERPADAAADQARNARLHAAFLVGGATQVHAVTDALGYRYAYDPRIRQYAHVAATAVLSPDGRLVRWLNGIAPSPQELQHALADARAERAGAFERAVALLCYHYDPQTGRYSLAVSRIVEAAGLLTVLVIAGSVVVLLRKGEA
ncbi:MAG: SCO family protein [Alphaproteobacteria bacterium]|nr:SCO family protein [Alphaproteobacteria bacterium]